MFMPISNILILLAETRLLFCLPMCLPCPRHQPRNLAIARGIIRGTSALLELTCEWGLDKINVTVL